MGPLPYGLSVLYARPLRALPQRYRLLGIEKCHMISANTGALLPAITWEAFTGFWLPPVITGTGNFPAAIAVTHNISQRLRTSYSMPSTSSTDISHCVSLPWPAGFNDWRATAGKYGQVIGD